MQNRKQISSCSDHKILINIKVVHKKKNTIIILWENCHSLFQCCWQCDKLLRIKTCIVNDVTSKTKISTNWVHKFSHRDKHTDTGSNQKLHVTVTTEQVNVLTYMLSTLNQSKASWFPHHRAHTQNRELPGTNHNSTIILLLQLWQKINYVLIYVLCKDYV